MPNETRILAAALIAAAGLAACQQAPSTQASKPAAAPPPAATSVETNAPHEDHVIHNIHRLNDRIISGAVPEGPAAFDELRSLGIKTVISVDGATPDVELARSRGLRYVHLPITYAKVTDEERLAVARAIRDLPGPIFVHCHHGKHRAPAAAANAAVALGMISPEEAVAFMKKAGTAPSYEGLYACAAAATVASAAALNAAPADFPEVSKPHGIVAAMVEVDFAWENIGAIRAAGWQVPKDHPDLVPAAEAGRLTDHLRNSAEDDRSKERGAEFLNLLMESARAASDLEEAIVAKVDSQKLESLYQRVEADCKSCHAKYRNK